MSTQTDLFGSPSPAPTRKTRVRAHERTVTTHNTPTPRKRAQIENAAPKHAIRETSLEARDTIRGGSARMRETVYDALKARGAHGATDEELVAITGLQLQTVNPRRGELVAVGRVVRSERRRPTSSGRSAIVWVAA